MNALVERGGRAGLILHRAGRYHAPIEVNLDPRVRVFDLSHLPPLEECGGELGEYVEAYVRACESMAPDGRLWLSPNLHGDDYGVAAAVSRVLPIGVVGWCHLDSAYDRAVLGHFEPCVSRFVAVSTATAAALRESLPSRAADVVQIPYGVPVAAGLPVREPRVGDGGKGAADFRGGARIRGGQRGDESVGDRSRSGGERLISRTVETRPTSASGCNQVGLTEALLRPVRLAYVGRIEEGVKRVSVLIGVSDALMRRGVAHELALVGDGPASDEIDAAIATRPCIRRVAPVGPHEAAEFYAAADFFLLPSRAEGLSLAMLEAMGQGCIPVVTAVRSGPSDAFEDGISGMLVEDSESGEVLAERFAETIARCLDRATAQTLSGMAEAALGAAARFSVDRHADRVCEMLAAAEGEDRREWPIGRPARFSGSGVVPVDGRERLRAALEGLRGERVVVHGVGRHTQELADVFDAHSGCIVAFTDDNPLTHGTELLGKPVMAPPGPAGATAVVISSHIHQADILARVGVYGNVRVVLLYPGVAGSRHSACSASAGATLAGANRYHHSSGAADRDSGHS